MKIYNLFASVLLVFSDINGVLGQYGAVSLGCQDGVIRPRIPLIRPAVPMGVNPARRRWREAVVRLNQQIAWLRARLACGNNQRCFRAPFNSFFNPPCCPGNPAPLIPQGRYCDQYFNRGIRNNGIFTVIAAGVLIEVYCQFQTDGHNWIVFQRRQDATVDFYQNWQTYRVGFGTPAANFWLGLDNLYALTSSGTCKLRVDLQDWSGGSAYAEYSFFRVGSPNSYYQLSVGYFRGTAGDSLRRHNNMRFSTLDFDNDNWAGSNCAVDNHGGWWYNACQYSNLNGMYLAAGMMNVQGINWFHWKYNTLSMMSASMKMRDC